MYWPTHRGALYTLTHSKCGYVVAFFWFSSFLLVFRFSYCLFVCFLVLRADLLPACICSPLIAMKAATLPFIKKCGDATRIMFDKKYWSSCSDLVTVKSRFES
jgi:hypothetical protein